MALDYLAIVSNGVYPTTGKSDAIKSALWISQGLLNFALPSRPDSFLAWGQSLWGRLRWGRLHWGFKK